MKISFIIIKTTDEKFVTWQISHRGNKKVNIVRCGHRLAERGTRQLLLCAGLTFIACKTRSQNDSHGTSLCVEAMEDAVKMVTYHDNHLHSQTKL